MFLQTGFLITSRPFTDVQAWLATGTDLGGSLRIPASFCGIVGLRPSVGRVPQHFNGDPLAMGQLQLHAVSGPMARNVPDLALLLDAMAKQHPRSDKTKPTTLYCITYVTAQHRSKRTSQVQMYVTPATMHAASDNLLTSPGTAYAYGFNRVLSGQLLYSSICL